MPEPRLQPHRKRARVGLPDIRYIDLLWCSLAGLRCLRVVPVFVAAVDGPDDRDTSNLLYWLPDPCPTASLCRVALTLPCHADIPSRGSGVSSLGDVRLNVKDPQMDLCSLPWRPHHYMAPVEMLDPISAMPWSLCPRSCLARIVKKAELEHGLTFRVGFELEFVLGSADCQITEMRTYSSAGAFDDAAPILDELCKTLSELGLIVEQMHKESGPGQFEIVLGHRPVMTAVDGLLFAREAIVAVAQRHQRRVNFLPKYMGEHAGNGCHVHISLWRNGMNLLPPPGLTETTPSLTNLDDVLKTYCSAEGMLLLDETLRQFLGGLHALLPALMCFTTPTPNSFRRIQPRAWAGAFQGWGIGNKEVPLRLPIQSLDEGVFTNLEVKLCDATANPYIAVAALISAGLVGLELAAMTSKDDEPIQNPMLLPPPLEVDAGELSLFEQTRRGIRKLPKNWAEAKAHLMSPEATRLRELLGTDMVQACVATRESEWAALKGMTLDKEVSLLYDKY
ncbi:glutamine synthetase [Nannochloropsis oceanica]